MYGDRLHLESMWSQTTKTLTAYCLDVVYCCCFFFFKIVYSRALNSKHAGLHPNVMFTYYPFQHEDLNRPHFLHYVALHLFSLLKAALIHEGNELYSYRETGVQYRPAVPNSNAQLNLFLILTFLKNTTDPYHDLNFMALCRKLFRFLTESWNK